MPTSHAHLTPVERALLDCLRATRDPRAIRRDITAPGFDWPTFLELAARQDVLPLVARVLAEERLSDELPAAARAELDAARLETTAQNLAARAELAAIAAQLGRLGIPVIPLKGVTLAERVFGGLDTRRCGDIDILVRADDWAPAHRVLLELGYRPSATQRPGLERHTFHGLPLVRAAHGRGYTVELHHHLTDPRFAGIDHAALWERALAGAGDNLVELPAEELLAFLALHMAKHDAGLLRLLADIDHLIAGGRVGLDWARAVALAASWRAGPALFFALEAASALLGTPVPAGPRQALQAPAWRRRAVSALAGPVAMLRPPAGESLRSGRFRLAYCLMLAPRSTALRAYWHYILAPPGEQHARFARELGRRAMDLASGAARTALVVCSVLGERRAPQQPGPDPSH